MSVNAPYVLLKDKSKYLDRVGAYNRYVRGQGPNPQNNLGYFPGAEYAAHDAFVGLYPDQAERAARIIPSSGPSIDRVLRADNKFHSALKNVEWSRHKQILAARALTRQEKKGAQQAVVWGVIILVIFIAVMASLLYRETHDPSEE